MDDFMFCINPSNYLGMRFSSSSVGQKKEKLEHQEGFSKAVFPAEPVVANERKELTYRMRSFIRGSGGRASGNG